MKTISSSIYLTFVAVVLASWELLPQVQAVTPPSDGCYLNLTTAEGCNALTSLTTGTGNTGLGWRSLFLNSNGSFNTGVGAGTLALNTADSNTAVGAAALLFNTTGTLNTANGAFALLSNTTGSDNTAAGVAALQSNTTGVHNTAIGLQALSSNIGGNDNTATGVNALFSNTTGLDNTAIGFNALMHNNSDNNTAIGSGALQNNTTGNNNTANGVVALFNNTTGSANMAFGAEALNSNTSGGANTAIGGGALRNNTTGFDNTAVGNAAGLSVTTASNVICIGSNGANVNDSCFIGHIHGVTTQLNDAVPVVIDSGGQLGTASSSRRFKTDVKPIDKASESILALKPVTFRYKIHKDTAPQFGLIAEEVAEINPDLVIYDADGNPFTVRYDAVNAMLLNEFLKEHRKNERQETIIVELKSTVAQQQKQIEALTALVQKVSAEIELSKPAPQTVLNNQ